MIIKVDDLIGEQLNYAVAKALGWVNYPSDSIERGQIWHIEPNIAPHGNVVSFESFRPSKLWNIAGPIMEKHNILIRPEKGTPIVWSACMPLTNSYYWLGDTPLVAAMRCLVGSVFGNEIEIPVPITS